MLATDLPDCVGRPILWLGRQGYRGLIYRYLQLDKNHARHTLLNTLKINNERPIHFLFELFFFCVFNKCIKMLLV
jgi:hypothetical protein